MKDYLWIPVYLESPARPERRAGVVVGLMREDGGNGKVAALISAPMMEAITRGTAEWARVLVEETVKSLGNFMSTHRTFADWTPAVPGAVLGQEQRLQAENMEDALDKVSQSVMNSTDIESEEKPTMH